jgi:UDP-2,3-diacylglucosamine pyrophosphatase LpxH
VNSLQRISKIFHSSEEVVFDDSSRIVLMSDCHRGDGNWSDDFSRNQNIFFRALTYYYENSYSYIELGDGDELWENKRLSDIIRVHSNVFWLLSKFYKRKKLYFIYGNHDMVKKNHKYVKKHMYKYFDERQKKDLPLFENIKVHEGLILRHKVNNYKIFLIHGHQVELLNNELWKITRFLVRYLWRPLNFFGLNDPTKTADSYHRKHAVEKKLIEWIEKENQMLIAGHTHRPMFPKEGEPLYFNTGSTVHPRCITGIEINHGQIQLVKWYINTKRDGTLFIDRKVLVGPAKLCQTPLAECYISKV